MKRHHRPSTYVVYHRVPEPQANDQVQLRCGTAGGKPSTQLSSLSALRTSPGLHRFKEKRERKKAPEKRRVGKVVPITISKACRSGKCQTKSRKTLFCYLSRNLIPNFGSVIYVCMPILPELTGFGGTPARFLFLSPHSYIPSCLLPPLI